MSIQTPVLLGTLLVAIAVSLPLLVTYFLRIHRRHEAQPFRFLDLPIELREAIYSELVDHDEIRYPKPKAPAKRSFFSLSWIFSKRPRPFDSSLFMLASKQINQEYSAVLGRNAKFILTLDQHSMKNPELWQINPVTKKNIRKCEVRMVATSNMLGAADPRHMSRSWPLRDRVCEELSSCTEMQDLSLHVHAIGDPLWNPLWVWYHSSQTFKTAETSKFSTISFSLDSPFGENHLSRNKDGAWEWRCPRDHTIMPDKEGWQAVREFCHTLFAECDACKDPPQGLATV